MGQVLDGRALRRKLNQALAKRLDDLPRPPGLAVVLASKDPASEIYVRMKGRVADRLGFVHRQIDLPPTVTQRELESVVDELNADTAIDGILVQLPLYDGLDEGRILDRIDPEKDVDGFTDVNFGRLAQGRPGLVPCTALGVIRLLEEAGVTLEGADACVVGRSNIVGRPVAMLLEQRNATVTVCHSRTRDLEAVVRRSDVVVAAVGVPELIEGAWIKEGAAVIDVGVNRLDDDSLVGDVEFDAAAERAGAITPVPGGVGPMTIAMLMHNTFEAARARLEA